MLRNLILAGALTATPIALSDTASADHNRCYRGHRAPVAVYRVPSYGRYDAYRYRGVPSYRYGAGYRSVYGANPYRYGGNPYGYGRYGYGYPYSQGTSIGIGRGGINLNFGF